MAPPAIEVTSPSSLNKKMREKLVVALDVADAQSAQETVRRLGEAAGMFKIGLQLFTAEGPGIVREMVASGRRVFLDLKLHDIPNTVAHAVKSAVELGPSMITVHASGGAAVLRAAVEAAAGRTKVLAVTVLTSFSDQDLQHIGIPDRVSDQVLRLATLARTAGCAGVVCSARETAQLRKFLGEGFAIVNPGVRPAGADTHDQERIATPSEAISAGASYIVVGRPITAAADPGLAVEAIVTEMAGAFSERDSSRSSI